LRRIVSGSAIRRLSTPGNPNTFPEIRTRSEHAKIAANSPKAIFYLADFLWKNGAGEGIRTLDPNLGKVVLYP
jgi:hypothetical protein